MAHPVPSRPICLLSAATLVTIGLCALPPTVPSARAERPLLLTGLAFDVGSWRPGIDPTKAGRPYGAAAGDLDNDGRPDLVVANFDHAVLGTGAGNTVSVLLSEAAPIVRLFQPKANYATGTGPNRVAIADLNVDGRQDVVTANASGSVSAMLGDGTGGLAAPITAGWATDASGLAVANLNGDGKPDLVIGHSLGDIVSLLGNGNGTFSFGGSFTTATSGLRNLAVGDLNADGRTDVVTANETSNTFSVFLGNGLGGFVLWTTVPTGLAPQDVAVGDVSGDGIADVVVATGGSTSIAVHLGVGGGGFGVSFPLVVGTDGPWSVEIADVNADTALDIVVSCVGGSLTNVATMIVFTNLGGGSFDTAVVDAGPYPGQVVVSDFNVDGYPDAAVPTWSPTDQTHTALVFLNQGGSLASLRRVPVGDNPSHSAIADLDCDGDGDLVVVDDSDLEIHLGGGDGTFAPYTVLGVPAVPIPGELAVGDVNRDTHPDILVNASGTIFQYIGNGDGTFGAASVALAGFRLHRRSIADMNRDGRPDLVLSDGTPQLQIFLQDALGAYIAAGSAPLAFPAQDVAIGDWDRDGKPDVAAALADLGGGGSSGGLYTFHGNADGTLAAGVIAGPARRYLAVCAGDWDRDGKPDLAGREVVQPADDAVGGAVYFLGNGLGGFPGAGQRLPLIDRGGSFIEAWDANNDGSFDLAASSGYNGTGTTELTSIGIYMGDGLGHFGQRTDHVVGGWPESSSYYGFGDLDRDDRPDLAGFTHGTFSGGPTISFARILLNTPIREGAKLLPKTDYAMGLGPQELAVGDLDRDGKLDVVTTSTLTAAATVRLGNGEGALGPPLPIATAPAGQSVRLGDFNRDGILDLAAVAGSVSIQPGVGNGTFLPGVAYAAGPSCDDIELADFNRDGKLDIVAGGGGDDFVYVLEGVGDGTFLAGPTIFVGGGFDVEVGDMTCDGLTEIVVANGSLVTIYASGDMTWFGPVTDVPLTPIGSISVADLNHDGKSDVAATATLSNNVLTFFASGLFSYSVTGIHPVLFPPSELIAGDTSADGVPDLFVIGRTANAVTVLRGIPPFGYDTGGALSYVTGGTPLGVALGDFNRDGLRDVATANFSTANVSILLRGDHALTAVADAPAAPALTLAQNHPNPFNPSTEIRFRLGASGPTRLGVFDVRGRRVATLVDRALEAGEHRVAWRGRGDGGETLASGVYFYRLESAGKVESKKMVMAK